MQVSNVNPRTAPRRVEPLAGVPAATGRGCHAGVTRVCERLLATLEGGNGPLRRRGGWEATRPTATRSGVVGRPACPAARRGDGRGVCLRARFLSSAGLPAARPAHAARAPARASPPARALQPALRGRCGGQLPAGSRWGRLARSSDGSLRCHGGSEGGRGGFPPTRHHTCTFNPRCTQFRMVVTSSPLPLPPLNSPPRPPPPGPTRKTPFRCFPTQTARTCLPPFPPA